MEAVNANTSVIIADKEEFYYPHLKAYAKFLLENKLAEFVAEQVELSYSMKVPVMKFFTHLSREEITRLSYRSNEELLTSIIEGSLESLIEERFNAWKTNQIPMLSSDQLVSEDLMLASYIRKQAFASQLKYYTSDVDQAMTIMNEVDQYILRSESRAIRFYIDLQHEKIQEQLSLVKQNEKLYQVAESLTHIGNWTWDISTNEVKWSDEMFRMLELDVQSEQISFERFTDFIHPEERDWVVKLIKDSLRQHKNLDFQHRILLPSGKVKHVHVIGEITTLPDGSVAGMHGTRQDVTQEYLLRQQLAIEKSFAESLIDNSPQFIMAYDKQMLLNVWNTKSEQFSGLLKKDVIGKNVFDLFPDYKKATWAASIEKALKGRTVHLPKVEFLNGEGWGESFLIPLKDKDGSVNGILSITNDITQRVEAQDLLEQKKLEVERQRDFVETIVDASVDVIVVLDNKMRYRMWNKKAEEIYGIKKENVLGKKINEAFNVDTTSKAYTDIERALKGERIHNEKIKSAIVDKYFENYLIPLRNDKDEVYGLLTIAHDNTEILKNSELLLNSNNELEKKIEELHRSDDRFHKMTEEVQDYAIILLNVDGNIEKWNRGAEKIKGYKAAEIIGKNFRIFYPQKDQEDNLPEKLLNQARRNGRVTHAGWRIRKNGTAFWGNVVITTLHDSEKNIIGFTKVTHDLTEKKLAEDNLMKYTSELEKKNRQLEDSNDKLKVARKQLADDRMRYLIEKMPHIVATAKADGTLEYANENLANFTGLSFSALKSNNWFRAIHPEDLDRVASLWQYAFNSGEDLQAELRLRRSDGEYLWHLAIAKPLKDEDNMIFLWLVTLTNINDQKLIEQNKDEFIGIASHELKTPLTSAKAYMQLVQSMIEKDNGSDVETALFVQKANSFIDKLNLLISELLDITKIRHGKLHLNFSTFDLQQMISENIEFIQPASGHKIILETSKSAFIRADKERLQQVIYNLVSNAIKYSPDADKVTVSYEMTKDEVLVMVKDEGIGIPKSDLEKIFERFYRVEKDGSKFQGLGIGLFISAEIIKRHNGKIWVESEPGKGSVFYFSIPTDTDI